jgi:hypothetical protein
MTCNILHMNRRNRVNSYQMKKEHKRYKLNPSVAMMTGIVVKEFSEAETKVRKSYIDPETGEEVVLERKINSEYKRNIKDTAQFRKLFVDIDLNGLSSTGAKLLDYVVKNLVAGKDEIPLPVSTCMIHCGWGINSRAAYYAALDNLLGIELLYLKEGSSYSYYVNVNKLFNGKREKLYAKFGGKATGGNDMENLIRETIELYKL